MKTLINCFLVCLTLYITTNFSKAQEDLTNIPFHAGLVTAEQFSLPENTVYIDPEITNTSFSDGSSEHPFPSFENIIFRPGYCYAIKRNTVLKATQIVVSANDVTIANYGKGKKPHIICTEESQKNSNKHGILVKQDGIENLTIHDIEISAPKATSCIQIMKNCKGLNIINCKLHDSYWGIRSIGNKDIFIHNTEVYNTNDDGVFIQYCQNIEISNCYIHHVNLNWQPPHTPETSAAGDGIQFSRCNNWHVHHNHIDRKNSGNKFCFISNNPDQDNGILEYNFLQGPTTDASLVYIGDGKDLLIRYNFMTDCPGNSVYTHSNNMKFYGNIVVGGGKFYTSKNAQLFNNLFFNVGFKMLQGNEIELSNNIFKSTSKLNSINVNKLSGSNNLFVNGNPTLGSFSGNPHFKDPEKLNFSLLEISDCIDAGILISGYTKDIAGNTVPNGKAPDIGPIEFIE